MVVAELALHRVLRGNLPRLEYPEKLRITASQRWPVTSGGPAGAIGADHTLRDTRPEG
jgi:hypothetical protein